MDKIKIADLWFMGGKGNPAKGISISDGEEGKRHTPCGSCRHVIQSHGINDGTGTNVHLLPLNDGSWKLQPFDHRKQDNTPREMVMSKSARELLPLPELRIGDPDGQMKRDIAHGVQWLLKPPEGKKGSKMGSENGIISSLGLLERDIIKDNNSKKSGKPAKQRELQPELLDAINRTLHEAIKRELYRDGPRRILRATACIVRTTSGEYILGSNFEDGIVRSTPEGEFNAIGNIRRRDITDAFILNLDIPAIERTVPRWFQHAKPDPSTQTSEAVATVMLAPTHASDPIALPTLQGNTLERLKKSHTRDPNAQSPFGHASTIPLVHLFTLGAPGRFDPQRHCHSQPLHHLIPDGYEHPKSTQKGHSTPRPLIAPDTLELLEQLEPPKASTKPRRR